MKNKAKITLIVEIIFVGLLILAFTIFSKLIFSKSEPTVGFDQYVWQNLTSTVDPPLKVDNSPYEPLALKISGDIEKQTGVALETVVAQGGKVVFNFFYNGTSPAAVGHCELVEVIILSKDDKIIEDYFLEYSSGELVLDSI